MSAQAIIWDIRRSNRRDDDNKPSDAPASDKAKRQLQVERFVRFLYTVKQAVDRDRRRGQLLLTGSTSYLADRSVSETLAGRLGLLVLWPLSAGEHRGVRETFLDRLLDPQAWPPPPGPTVPRDELVAWILEGGFPEVVTEGLRGRRRRACGHRPSPSANASGPSPSLRCGAPTDEQSMSMIVHISRLSRARERSTMLPEHDRAQGMVKLPNA